MTQHEKRSQWHAGMQVDWVGHDDEEGVGARQPEAHGLGRGGGYLYECTTPKVWEDAKLRELADMGMPLIWMEVAQAIGFDAFMKMWRLLDAEYDRRPDAGSMIEIDLRRYRSYMRFQRNRFIEALAPFLTNQEIRDRVADELGEELSLDHVQRLATPYRIVSQ